MLTDDYMKTLESSCIDLFKALDNVKKFVVKFGEPDAIEIECFENRKYFIRFYSKCKNSDLVIRDLEK